MAMAILGRNKTNYPYAVARVSAKKGRLIPRSEYDKLFKMDVSEITRFIEESEYKTEVDELASRFGGLDLLEAALTVNEERTYASIRRMLDGEGGEILARFLMRHFVEDIKTVLRGKVSGADRQELLKELLLEDLDTYHVFMPLLADEVQGIEATVDAFGRQGGIAAEWARVLRKVPEGSPLPRYEDALDKAYFARLLEAAEGFSQEGGHVLREFARLEVDARNLRNAARWVQAGADGDFTPYVIPGGKYLPVQDVMALAACKDLAAFDELLQAKPFYGVVAEGLARTRKTGRLAPFGLAVQQNLILGLDRLAHIHPLSIVPILTFIIRKRHEVVSLRTLARGKAAGLDERRLRELLP